jgi:K+-sensing histidine kinase KdpD
MISRPQPDPTFSRILSYFIALGAVAVAIVVRLSLDPWLQDSLPLVTLYGAVAAAAWWGGWRPALFAAVIGGVFCEYWFHEPRGELHLSEPRVAIGLGAYLITCAVVVGFAEVMRRAQRASREQR